MNDGVFDFADDDRVAIVSGAEDRLVAEAGYALLPDGNGEFALTVAAGWRGWLGPYLLDAIVTAAADMLEPWMRYQKSGRARRAAAK